MDPFLDPSELPNGLTPIKRLSDSPFGVAFLAQDASGAHCVLKVSRDEVDEHLLQRELEVGRALSHPNLVRVRSVFRAPSGRAVLLRDWIDGRSLEEIIADSPLRVRDALDVIGAIARGVAAMHERKLIHRDLKPANVLVPFHDHRPLFREAKVSDFGLVAIADALYADSHSSARTITTVTGVIIGTPTYMAPEQARGDAVTPATDVHALGIILFELLYGKTPFARDSFIDMLIAIANDEVRLPSYPKLPTSLRRLLLRSTRKHIADRPQTATIFLEELEFAKDAVIDTGIAAFFGVSRDRATTMRVMGHADGILLLYAGLVLASVAGAIAMRVQNHNAAQAFFGAAMIGAGIAIGGAVKRAFTRRRRLADVAAQIILGVEDREAITRSLVIQIEELVERCQRVDQKILGTGLVLQLQEYRAASNFADRQLAFAQTMNLVEKILQRLVPWYARYERLLTVCVSLLGVIPGLITAILGIVKFLQQP